MASSSNQTSTNDVVSRPPPESGAQELVSASQANNGGISMSSITSTKAFASYKDYLASIVEEWPEYQDLYIRFGKTSGTWHDSILVLEETGCTLKSQISGRNSFDENHLATLKLSLKACLEDMRTRVVVVLGDNSAGLEEIGLIYDVDPAFFLAAPIRWSDAVDESDERHIPISDSPKIFQLPGKMAAQVLKHRNAAGQELSVGKFDALSTSSKDLINSSAVLVVVYMPHSWRPLIEDRPPRPHAQIDQKNRPPRFIPSGQYIPHLLKHYQNIMDSWNEDQIQAANIDPLLYIQPYIRLLAEDLYTKVSKLRFLHRKFVSSRLEKEEISPLESVAKATEVLCSELDDFDLFIQKFRDRVSNTQQGESIDYYQGVLKHGRRITQLSRETLQTNFSLWSIRDSNRSIEEAKSLKRLTQLAFIFIPLSFVTSLFGMNVQELSGNGVKLWIFLVTAMCMGCSTILFWRLLGPIQAWLKRHPSRKKGGRWSFFRDTIEEGYLLGAIKSGAIMGFLTNGRFGPHVDEDGYNYYFELYTLSGDRARI